MMFEIGVAISCGLILQLSLSISGQRWARTLHVVLTYLSLPVITCVVTSLIAGDIALSLGMVGALSIVRFRNPVKSPLELVIYFALITIGIAVATNISTAIILCLVISLLIVSVSLLRKVFISKQIDFFSASFHEGESLYFLEAETKKALESLDTKGRILQHSTKLGENESNFYRIEFQSYEAALSFVEVNKSIYEFTNFQIIRN